MKLLSRDGNAPNKTVKLGGLTHNQLTARSTFVRMTSGLEQPVTIMGGELIVDETDATKSRLFGTTVKGKTASGYDEIYGSRSFVNPYDDTEILGKNNFKRPLPGLKSIDVTFQGGTRALREGTISWTCWSFEDVDRLTSHFLSVGKTVMVEWGWVYDKDSLANLPTFIDSKNNIKRDAYTDYKNTVLGASGDIDMMVGIVKNFNFNTREDGGFDCTTTITSMGVNILDNPIPAKEVLPTAVKWDLSSNLTDEEVEELANANFEQKLQADFNVTLKVLIENIDNYLVDKVIDKKTNKVKKGYKQDRVTNYLELPPESAEATGVKSYPDNFNLSTSPNQFIVEHGVVSTGKKDNSNKFVNFESLKINTVINNAWVRWGWFEDNILSKFLSQVSESDIPTAEFRSVNRVEDTDGNQTKKLESTRIRNSPYLDTIDTKKYILPGQFTPLVIPKKLRWDNKVTGDSDYIRKLSKMVNQNFGKFSAGNETVTRVEKVDESYIVTPTGEKIVTNFIGPTQHEIKTRQVEKEREVDVIGKLGFMRNMLINTKLIKEAFGVNEGGVETVTVREAIEHLFSLLNQDINFWKFQLQNDEHEPYRTKIIDTSITEKLPKEGEVISSPSPKKSTTKSTYNNLTDTVTNRGVFFFPVWQHNSIVKSQNITATIPSSMAVSIMYGANADIAGTTDDTPPEASSKEATILARSGNDPDNPDSNLKNLSIPLHQKGYHIYGTRSTNDNSIPLSKKGGDDNLIKWLRNNPGLIKGNYTEKQQQKNEAIQEQEKMDTLNKENLIIDTSVPPPIPTPTSNLSDKQWKSLAKTVKGLDSKNLNLLDLYSSKYDKENKLKEKFIESIKYNTTNVATITNESEGDKTVLLPFEIQLDIDGIGGIYPGNSFHSTYVPRRYQDRAVFQVFDVTHSVSSDGWTTSLRGKMRSSLTRVTTITTTLKKIMDIKSQFENAKSASDLQLKQEDEQAAAAAAEAVGLSRENLNKIANKTKGKGKGVTPGSGRPVK